MISLETANDLIARSRHRSVWASPNTIVLLLIGGLAGAMLARPDWVTGDRQGQLLLPEALLLSLFVWVWTRAIRQRRTAAAMVQLWEAVQLRDWSRAEGLVTRLLRRPVQPVPARAQSLLALAAVADGQKQYVVSQHVLESVLRESGGDRSLHYAARVALASTMLRTQQLTDAVALIDRLVREELPPPLRAQVEVVNLFRLVLMGQAEEAVAGADARRSLFRRHLGTRAGYGYALLAAAFDRAGQPDRAAELWQDATLLVRPNELVDRFAELDPVARKYPATEWPL